MYQAFKVDDDAIVTEFIENSICCQLPVNDKKLQKLVSRQIHRHSYSLARNQRMEVDFITQKHLKGI